jgi:hypothetical protein
MTPIAQKLFAPRPGESEDESKKRIEDNGRTFKAALSTKEGKALLRLLYSESHPLWPRYGAGQTPEESAYLDGERCLIGCLWLNGTTDKTL